MDLKDEKRKDSSSSSIEIGMSTELLASLASTLLENEQISERDCENFRISISEAHMQSAHNSDSIIKQLLLKSDKITALIFELLSHEGFHATIIAQSFEYHHYQLKEQLARLGEHLIGVSKKYFNRSVYQKITHDRQDAVLLGPYCSNLLVFLEKILNQMQVTYDKKIYAKPLTTETENLLHDFNSSYGASKLVITDTPIQNFKDDSLSIFYDLKIFFESVTRSISLTENSNSKLTEDLLISSKILHAKIEELVQLVCSIDRENINSNICRQALNQSLQQLNHLIMNYTNSIMAHTHSLKTKRAKNCLTERQLRLILVDLLRCDVEYASAKIACGQLDQYLIDNKVEFSKLIPQELIKINKHLAWVDLAKMAKVNNETNSGSVEQKSSILKKLSIFEKVFSDHMNTSITIMLTTLLLGCGVKKRPQPLTEPVRPEIPFHKDHNHQRGTTND